MEIFPDYPKLLVEESLNYKGHPSVKHGSCTNDECDHGANLDPGLDCSGFVKFLLHEIDFPAELIPRHAREFLYNFGKLIHYPARQAGDLAIFSRDGRRPTHIGILIDRYSYIHAPGKNGTQIEVKDLEEEELPDLYGDLQPYRYNPIALKRLAIPDEYGFL